MKKMLPISTQVVNLAKSTGALPANAVVATPSIPIVAPVDVQAAAQEVPVKIPSTRLRASPSGRRIIVPSTLPRVSSTAGGSLVQIPPTIGTMTTSVTSSPTMSSGMTTSLPAMTPLQVENKMPNGSIEQGSLGQSSTDTRVPIGLSEQSSLSQSSTDTRVPIGLSEQSSLSQSSTDTRVPIGLSEQSSLSQSSTDTRVPIGLSEQSSLSQSSTDTKRTMEVTIPAQSPVRFAPMSTRPKPLSPTIGINPTIIDNVGNNDIFHTLVANDLVPLEQVTIDENNVKKIKYYQAYNTDGDIFYVKIDNENGTTGVTQDFKTFREIKGMDIPLSYKLGLAKCANSVLCGVAFQCKGDVCFLRENGDSGQFVERSYSEISDHVNQTLTNPKYPVALPIVSLSEVVANKEEARGRVRMATKRIWETVFKTTDNSLKETITSLNNLTLEAIKFRDGRKAFHQQIMHDTEILRNHIDTYRRYAKMDTTTKDRFKLTVDNMFIRVKAFLKLINLTNTFNKLQNQIDSIRDKVEKINKEIHDDMKEVSGAIPANEVDHAAKKVNID
jgi:hypothetical protein